MVDRAPLPPINFRALADALLARADHLVPAWLPAGHRAGHEYVCGSLSGGKGASCSVNLTTGQWADFASDEKGGDLVSLYAAIHGLDMGRAAVQVARDEGLEDVAGVQPDKQHQRPAMPKPPPPPSKPPKVDEGWVTVLPVPVGAPEPTFKHYHRSREDFVRQAEYRVGDELHGYVVRFRTSGGGKDDLPYTWCTSTHQGGSKWVWRQFDEPRPLYLPGHALPAGRTVVLVEGERKGELLQALLDAGAPGVYCVASWPGGCKAWAKANWSWLAGSTVLAWPDCDSKRVPLTAKERNACADDAARTEAAAAKPYLPADKQPGMAAMLGLGELLVRERGCTVSLLPIEPPGVKPDGWDAADAIEADGWGFDEVLGFFGRAYALPVQGASPSASAESAAPGESKKREGPANAAEVEEVARVALPCWLECFYDASKGRWSLSRKAVIFALKHDEQLANVLGYNELTNSVEARQEWPWVHGRAGDLEDATDLLLGNWLSIKYGIPAISRQALTEGILTIGYEHRFHPVRNWLQGLKWDGVSRINKWLLHVIGETPETLSRDRAEYLSLVGRFWLLGMVHRIMRPGCKFDYMAVLEGPGGLGKSTLVKELASKDWYSDTAFDLSKGKESQEQVGGVWLYEIGEMSAMAKAEVTAIKAFVSSEVDRYRVAYGRTVTKHPRQCVLVGTTNESTYLRDRTGNRRFWPVPVRQQVRVEWLKKWREQLFAEAFALFEEGVPYIPSLEQEKRLFAPEQDARLVETGVTSELLHVLTREGAADGIRAVVNGLTDFVTLSQLLQALCVDPGKSTAGLESQIRTYMNQQGWEYKKKQLNGVRQAGWHRPQGWPVNEEDAPAEPSAAPAGPFVESYELDDAPF